MGVEQREEVGGTYSIPSPKGVRHMGEIVIAQSEGMVDGFGIRDLTLHSRARSDSWHGEQT